MTSPEPPLVLDLDASGYLQSLGQADQATDQFSTRLRQVPIAIGPVQGALNAVTPSRASLAGMAAFAAVAANAESQLSSMRATARVTGASFGDLTKGMRQLARDVPIGNAGARELTQSLTRLGLSGTTSAAGFSALAKSFAQMGGANGESPTSLAQGFIQLNRAMNTGFDPGRMTKLGDSLTTVAAKSGASASGILQFSKAIAPMAQASGIGETKVLGISAAFSKLGEDGFAGATAFNRMLTDLNRSVREGSPTMAAYAQIVGKTTGQFRELFQANPAEALTQVTEAIGRSPNAPRQLEQLGLDGIRTQRSIQNLIQSGGLRSAIAESTNAYGSGSTSAAAATAYHGLNDSLVKLRTNAEQLAEAFGTPFLGALTHATNLLGAVATPARSLAGNRVVQDVLTGVAYGALPLLLARRFGGMAMNGALGAQLLSSGPVGGFAGGYMGAGGVGSGLLGRLPFIGRAARDFNARMVSPQQAAYESERAALASYRGNMTGNDYRRSLAALNQTYGAMPGTVGGRFLIGANTAAGQFGAGFGRFTQGTMAGFGPGLLQQLRGAGVAGVGLYGRLLSEQLRMPRLPAGERDYRLRLPGEAYDRFFNNREALQSYRSNMSPGDYRRSMAQLYRDAAGDIGGTRSLVGTAARAGGSILGQGALTGLTLAGRGALGALSLAGGVPGALLLGGMVGYQAYSRSRAADKAANESAANAGSTMDDYLVAMGKATSATSTFAGQMAAATKTLENSASTFGSALQVTSQEIANAASAPRRSRVVDYSGSVGQAKRRVALQTQASGATPDVVQRIQQDLLMSGFSPDQVRDISSSIHENADLTADVTGTLRAQGASLGKGNAGGFRHNVLNRLDVVGGISRMSRDNAHVPGVISDLSSDQKSQAEKLVADIRDRSARRGKQFQGEYATSQEYKEIDALVKGAIDAGNYDLVERIQKDYLQNAGVSTKYRDRQIGTKDIASHGGSYTAALADLDTQGFGVRRQAVLDAEKAGKATPVLSQGWIADALGGGSGSAANPLASWLSATNTTALGKATQNLIGPSGQPEDPHAQAAATQAWVTSARATGMSMQDLARNAGDAANKLAGAGDAATIFMQNVADAAQQQLAAEDVTKAPGTQALHQGQVAAGFAGIDPKNDPGGKFRQMGLTQLLGGEQAAVAQAQSYLKNQQEFQVSSARMAADYRRQGVYATQDYERTISRSEQDFYTQRSRMAVQFELGITRASEDYGMQRGYAIADYHKQVLRSEQDFSKSMRRAAEDSARATYDPYQRIQVQATWDARNLLGNLSEQNAQIAQQVHNLGRLREMGGTSNLIKLLGLNDPKNAQQLANLVDDVTHDPRVLGSLNRAAAARQGLGGKLATDADNTPRQRALEDFREQMKRGAVDFETALGRQAKAFSIQMARGRQDYGISLRQMAEDHARMLERAGEDRALAVKRAATEYATTVQRMAADLVRADTVVTGDLAQLTDAMNKALSGQFVDFQGLTERGMKGWLANLTQYKDQWQKLVLSMGSDLQVTITQGATDSNGLADRNSGNANTGSGSTTQGAKDSNGLADRASGDGIGMGYQRQAAIIQSQFPGEQAAGDPGRTRKTVSGNISYHTLGRAVDISPPSMEIFNWIAENYPNSRELIYTPAGALQLKNGSSHIYSADVAKGHYNHIHWAMANGGLVFGPGGPRDDRVNARLSAGEYVLRAQAVQAIGVPALDKLNALVSQDQLRGMHAASGVTYVTYDHSSTHNDHRVIIEHVDLKAESPRELAAAAAAKARQDNLTAPPQRRR